MSMWNYELFEEAMNEYANDLNIAGEDIAIGIPEGFNKYFLD